MTTATADTPPRAGPRAAPRALARLAARVAACVADRATRSAGRPTAAATFAARLAELHRAMEDLQDPLARAAAHAPRAGRLARRDRLRAARAVFQAAYDAASALEDRAAAARSAVARLFEQAHAAELLAPTDGPTFAPARPAGGAGDPPATAREVLAGLRALEAEHGPLALVRDRVDRTAYLTVTTPPVILDDPSFPDCRVELGRFTVRLALTRYRPGFLPDVDDLSAVPLEPRPVLTPNATRISHPFVYGASICLGSAQPAVAAALREGRPGDALAIVVDLLVHPGLDGFPYAMPWRWALTPEQARERIEDEGLAVRPDNLPPPVQEQARCSCGARYDREDAGGYCERCDEDRCDDCLVTCARCENGRCVRCTEDCAGCREPVCRGCRRRCQIGDCEDVFCADCRPTCDACGQTACADHSTGCDADDCAARVCEDCNGACADCDGTFCGEHRRTCPCDGCGRATCGDCSRACEACDRAACADCTGPCEAEDCETVLCADCGDGCVACGHHCCDACLDDAGRCPACAAPDDDEDDEDEEPEDDGLVAAAVAAAEPVAAAFAATFVADTLDDGAEEGPAPTPGRPTPATPAPGALP